MNFINVKPADGLVIRDPVLRDFIEADGRKVEWSTYWERLIRDKDVIQLPVEQPHNSQERPQEN